MASKARVPNQVYCRWCGAPKKLSDSSAAVGNCDSCGREVVDALALLGALGMWTGELWTCPTCDTGNALWHEWCFACGKKAPRASAKGVLPSEIKRAEKARAARRKA